MVEPSETIVFGEKVGGANFNRHMDLMDPAQTMDRQADDSRHSNSTRRQHAGGSNYACGDGSVRFIRWPNYLTPVNMWLVTLNARNVSRASGP
jgi:hypothetical protein